MLVTTPSATEAVRRMSAPTPIPRVRYQKTLAFPAAASTIMPREPRWASRRP